MSLSTRSHLVKMSIRNLGPIGPEGVTIALDDIVCLVGQNNTGKSTVLRAYEAAATNGELAATEVHSKDIDLHPDFVKANPTVEMWVHIPENTGNIDAKWKEQAGSLLLVRSQWEWPAEGGKPTRTTWDPGTSQYSQEDKASGLDSVFNSRLPRPFRIGSLDDPAEEHSKLLGLILEPIKATLSGMLLDEASPLKMKVRELQKEAEAPVKLFQQDLAQVQNRVSASYKRVFNKSAVSVQVSLGNLDVDPASALIKASHIGIRDEVGATRWSQQGTGSQRTLFWSMLEVRSELARISEERKAKEKLKRDQERELAKAERDFGNAKTTVTKDKYRLQIEEAKKKLAAHFDTNGDAPTQEQPFLPGYMLLIDEPETALHPSAVRAAKEHLYSLASQAGWQVMLTTHHPAFVDPLQDHTTIVRLDRPTPASTPHTYRATEIQFSAEERANLQCLLAFDPTVAEIFFASRVVIVEGDTEVAAFGAVYEAEPGLQPQEERPLLLRARGKWTIPVLIRMLAHFQVNMAVLHDVDAPRTKNGNANSAYSANAAIVQAAASARKRGVRVVHRCSIPEFERHHQLSLPKKDKPFEAWRQVRKSEEVRRSIKAMLVSLLEDGKEATGDGHEYEAELKKWASSNAPKEPTFQVDY